MYARTDKQKAQDYLEQQQRAGNITEQQAQSIAQKYGIEASAVTDAKTWLDRNLPSEMEFYKYRKGAGTYKQYIAQMIEDYANQYGLNSQQMWELAQQYGISSKDLEYSGTIQMYGR